MRSATYPDGTTIAPSKAVLAQTKLQNLGEGRAFQRPVRVGGKYTPNRKA